MKKVARAGQRKDWAGLAVTILTLLAPTASGCAVFAQAQKGVLQAGVEHAEQLAPVQSALKIGATFNEAKLEKAAPTKIWYRVPPWMAGKWQYDDQTQTSYQDCKTGATDSAVTHWQVHSIETWGSQRDRLGGVWDVMTLPFVSDVTSAKEIDKDLHNDDSVVFDSDAKVIARYVFTRAEVDKAKTIRSVYQMEQFTSLFPGGPKMLRSEASLKKFDDRGNAIYLTKSWRIAHKTAPVQFNNYDPSLAEYLKNQGLENLVPLPQ
jgi:hypothetical protein